jgi:hypothetical protein
VNQDRERDGGIGRGVRRDDEVTELAKAVNVRAVAFLRTVGTREILSLAGVLDEPQIAGRMAAVLRRPGHESCTDGHRNRLKP